MNERGSELKTKKDYNPDPDLRDFLLKRLELTGQMNKIRAAGKKYDDSIKSQDKGLGTKKVRILHRIVFQAMANLLYFFKMISDHPELQKTFEDDIKDLLGVRRYNPKSYNYGYVFSHLIAYILMIKTSGKPLKEDDFRLGLIQVLQGIVFLGFQQTLPDILKDRERFDMMLADLSKATAWVRALADHVEDKKISPHRVFPFIKSRRLD